jgi:hypothetical protein
MLEVAIPLGQAITQQSAAQLVMEYYARYRFHDYDGMSQILSEICHAPRKGGIVQSLAFKV